MTRLLLALPLLLGFVQEDPAIRDLVRKLEDADLEVRDKALRDLIAAGPKALDPLRKALTSESAEVRARAKQAIRAIELAVMAREVNPPYKSFTLKKSGTVGEILDELTRVSGLPVEATPEQRAQKATVDATTVLQALDQICSGSESLAPAPSVRGYKLISERFAKAPASYFEAFKVYMTEAFVQRKSDFKETTVTGRLTIHSAWETPLKPLKRVLYEFAPAKDDAGRDVEVTPASAMEMMVGGPGFWMAAGFGEDPDMTGPQAFGLKGLSPDAKSIASLKGTAKVSFPISPVDVTFEDPESGNKQNVGEITIKLASVSMKNSLIKINFTKSKGDVSALKDEILGRLEAGSVRVIDADGKEHTGDLVPFQSEMGAGGGVRLVGPGGPGGEQAKMIIFQAAFPSMGGKDFKRFTFRFSETLYEKQIPFEIKDIKLP